MRINTRRRVAYCILAASLPFLLLIAAEFIARAAGAGAEDQDAFALIPGRPDYKGINPAYAQRYFRGFTPSVAPDVFLAHKPDSSLRIFVLGGSSTAGYPYMFYSSFPAQLQRKLDRRFFDLQVEVVNLGMTAVNSYTLWDLRNAVVDEEPDAILIYAGHNEFYGAFGAGSTMYALGNKVWLKRLLLHLKNSVLFRRIDDAIRGSVDQPDQYVATRTMMSRLAGEQEIAFGDDVYTDGIVQLESNLNDFVETFERAGIPVFLSTITSNLRDQPPFGADSTAADEYSRGLQLAAQGQFAQARDAFALARDYDTIRFRAPSAINEYIREIALLRGATLVDCEARIRGQSENGVEGDDWFVDHLHLSAGGYGLIADAFFDALVEHFAYDGPSLRQPETEDLGLDPIDRAAAAINIERLTSGFPFVKEQSATAEAEALSRLVETKLTSGSKSDSIAMLMLMNRLSPPEALRLGLEHTIANGDTASALRLYRSLITLRPFDTGLHAEAAGLASSATRYDDILADIALEGVKRTHDDRFLGLLAATAIRGMRLDEAQLLLDRLERRNPDEPTMLFNQARLHVLLGDTAGAREYFLRFRAGQ
ncbi:MAG TPA: hypothetical protein VMO47_03515 [Rhodothermales bacterium]|nr:hypothetical protein [Rhodothermales bacterium]